MRWVVLLLPIPFAVYNYSLGFWLADPAAELSRWSGDWALRFLLASLVMGPLARAGFKMCFPWRKVLGVTAAIYALLHGFVFVWLYLSFDMGRLVTELVERPYIIVGALALVALFIMLLTSNQYSRRKLGRRWLKLHQLVFVAWGLVMLHFFWLVRSSYDTWAKYFLASILIVILRMWAARKQKNRQASKKLRS